MAPQLPDRCARCGAYFEVWHSCVRSDGSRYEHITDSPPGSTLYHPDCWRQYQGEKRAKANHALGEFVEGGV